MKDQAIKPLSRTIPQAVKRQLRKEVGFGCPAPGCGTPYLEYHHFDPPWAVEKHHDPDRMIALCSTHHAKADAWTTEQVRAMKAADPLRPEVQGRIEWMRHNVLAVVGGNFYYETPTILMLDGRRVVWFERDEKHHLLLNISMDLPGEPARTSLTNNDWTIRGDPHDVESPPSGSELSVKYPGGDFLRIRFREHKSLDSLRNSYPSASNFGGKVDFPIVVAQVELRINRAHIHLDGTKTTLPGTTIQGSFFSRCGIGLAIASKQQRLSIGGSAGPGPHGGASVADIVRKNSHLLKYGGEGPSGVTPPAPVVIAPLLANGLESLPSPKRAPGVAGKSDRAPMLP